MNSFFSLLESNILVVIVSAMGIHCSDLMSRENLLEGEHLADKLKLLCFQNPQPSLHQVVKRGESTSSRPFLLKQQTPSTSNFESHAAIILAEVFPELHCSLSFLSNPHPLLFLLIGVRPVFQSVSSPSLLFSPVPILHQHAHQKVSCRSNSFLVSASLHLSTASVGPPLFV